MVSAALCANSFMLLGVNVVCYSDAVVINMHHDAMRSLHVFLLGLGFVALTLCIILTCHSHCIHPRCT